MAIMKLGHWTSMAFMSYMHEQLDIISHGATQCISNNTSFINIDIQQALELHKQQPGSQILT